MALALPRLDALLAEGVGVVEVKSGYGLTIEAELNMLRAARALGIAPPGADRHQLSCRPRGAAGHRRG